MCYDFVLGMRSRIQDCLETSCNHTSTVKNGGQGIQAERHWIILAPFNCTAHGRVRHHQLPKMADALFEFVGSFSLVCAFVQL